MAKNNTYYFSHDGNARNDDKLIAVRMRLGAEGYGIYFMLIERLFSESEYMSVKDYNIIAFDLRVPAEKVKSIVEDFGLFSFTDDGKRFYSVSLLRRMEKRDEKSNKAKESVKKRWEAYERNTNVEKNDTNVIRTNPKSNTIKGKEIKEYNIPPNGGVDFASETPSPAPRGIEKPSNQPTSQQETLPVESGEEPKAIKNQGGAAEKHKAEDATRCDYQRIIDAFNRICTFAPRVIKLSESRKSKIKCRFFETGKSYETLERVFEKINASSFCRGENRSSWMATFDWIVDNQTNWVKVLEGNYDNKPQQQHHQTEQNYGTAQRPTAAGDAKAERDREFEEHIRAKLEGRTSSAL